MSTQAVPASKIPEIKSSAHKLIDVRSPGEYASVHVEGAELHPLDKLDAQAFCREHGTDAPVYILCQSGKRAEMAAEKLTAAGHQATFVIQGGTQSAIASGVECVRGKGTISIERQVRIVAGLLVLIGTLLGVLVHSAFFIVPAFVGAGLTFAGVTDTCGMAMMLGKCPWNQ